MILSHQDIDRAFRHVWTSWRNEEEIWVKDLRINPNSINCSLSNTILRPRLNGPAPLDLHNPNSVYWERETFEELTLLPGEFILASVQERFDCSEDLSIEGELHNFVQMIEGRSTVARCGLSIHSTAGFGDYGFKSTFTLEISTQIPIILRPGDHIAQVYFVALSPGVRKYEGVYKGDSTGPVAPIIGKERFE